MNRHHDKCAKSIWLTNWSIHPRTDTHIDTQTHTHMLLVNICAIKIRIETWPKQCFVIRMQMEVGKAVGRRVKEGTREGVETGQRQRRKQRRTREQRVGKRGGERGRDWANRLEQSLLG